MTLLTARFFTVAAALAILFSPPLRVNVDAAAVKPLEVFSEKILVLEIEYLASEHSLSSALLRKAVDRLNREMNVMSGETAAESLKLLADVSEKLSTASKSSSALSGYLSANSVRLKEAGHGRFLPLANIDSEVESAYHKALAGFVDTAFIFVRYCNDNLHAISSGNKEEGKRYDELYAAYLKDMGIFNDQSIKRSRNLADMGSEYPSLWELMPR